MKRFSFLGLALSVLLALLLAGCGNSGQSGPTAQYPTTSLQIRAGDTSSSTLSMQPLGFAGSFADVTSVSVVVSGEDQFGVAQNPLTSAALTLGSDGVWSATLGDLPIGPTLTFTATGSDASGTALFSGVTTQVLSGSGDTVRVAMAPVSDGSAVLFPVVTSVTLPAQVVVSSNADVAVGVKGSQNESLSYAFTAQDGTFTPATGSIALGGSGTGTVTTSFGAPASPASLTQSVQVTNSQGNSVVTDFPTTVVYGQTGTGLSVGFAPVVTGLTGKRSGNEVTWTAAVSDDGPASALVYSWSFGGTAGAAFSTADANPGVLSGYDATVTGTVSLTVTDGDNLSTTVTFNLPAGQFPDSVVVTTP